MHVGLVRERKAAVSDLFSKISQERRKKKKMLMIIGL